MKNWRMELTSGGKILTDAKIQGEIFQGNALLQILFVIAIYL